MPLRDLIVFATVFPTLPFCFRYPWIGILVFSWLGYMNPHRYTWGPAHDFPFAQVVAIVTLIGYILTKEKDRIHLERETVLIISLWIIFTLTSFWAFYPDRAWAMWSKTSKIFLISLLTISLFTDQGKLRYLMLTIALSLGLLGLKGGIFAILTGGSYNVRGPDGSFIAGEGDFGLALNMTLPLLFFLSNIEKDPRLRLLLKSCFFLSILAIIFTYRRGAFLTLSAVILLLLIRSQRRLLATFFLIIALILSPIIITEKWVKRMETITTYEKDSSAMGRIYAWRTAFRVAEVRPFSGAGFDGLTGRTIDLYSPNPSETAADVHSIYFEVLGEHGFIAFGLYGLLLLSTFLTLKWLQQVSLLNERLYWVRPYAEMLQTSLLAYMIGGAFLGRAYFDLFYQLVAITVILKVLVKREISYLPRRLGPHEVLV